MTAFLRDILAPLAGASYRQLVPTSPPRQAPAEVAPQSVEPVASSYESDHLIWPSADSPAGIRVSQHAGNATSLAGASSARLKSSTGAPQEPASPDNRFVVAQPSSDSSRAAPEPVSEVKKGKARAIDAPAPARETRSVQRRVLPARNPSPALTAVPPETRIALCQAKDLTQDVLQQIDERIASTSSTAWSGGSSTASALQAEIETPQVRELKDSHLIIGRFRPTKEDEQRYKDEMSDETFLRRHRQPEQLEKRSKRLERESLISERHRLRQMLQQLKAGENLSQLLPLAALRPSGPAQASATVLPHKSLSTKQRQLLEQSETDKLRLDKIRLAERTLERYDQLLNPRQATPILPSVVTIKELPNGRYMPLHKPSQPKASKIANPVSIASESEVYSMSSRPAKAGEQKVIGRSPMPAKQKNGAASRNTAPTRQPVWTATKLAEPRQRRQNRVTLTDGKVDLKAASGRDVLQASRAPKAENASSPAYYGKIDPDSATPDGTPPPSPDKVANAVGALLSPSPIHPTSKRVRERIMRLSPIAAAPAPVIQALPSQAAVTRHIRQNEETASAALLALSPNTQTANFSSRRKVKREGSAELSQPKQVKKRKRLSPYRPDEDLPSDDHSHALSTPARRSVTDSPESGILPLSRSPSLHSPESISLIQSMRIPRKRKDSFGSATEEPAKKKRDSVKPARPRASTPRQSATLAAKRLAEMSSP
ncbi:hypothetical protein E5Q_03250 [Mixia osmundae IAM 14324]|uniref:Something about silencing protein 4 domain-containing protein n=1 Tax=Mixia osmundae (strain CBS 9802 / IAM 14324 / JCM 22182 / KY 12970) TaxID=764103 RepID=G7E170_MIXOS|nr:hypothetical protein E5Q_03250 [Mixia osmundae IAM 14324]